MNLMKNKNLLFTFIIIVFSNCSSTNKPNDLVKIEVIKIKEWTGKTTGNFIVFSCIRCKCFNDEFALLKEKDIAFINSNTVFITDTICNKLKEISTFYKSQQSIDSLSEDLYNVTLIQLKVNTVKVKNIETKYSSNLMSIIKKFFN